MPVNNLEDLVIAAVALLPPTGSKIEFDAYKAQLYAAYPDGGRDAFAHMIKKGIVNKELDRNNDGKLVVMLSRKA